MSPDDEKARLRTEARAVRSKAFEVAGPQAAASIAEHGRQSLGPADGRIVAGYMAHGSEVDIGPLMAALAGTGATLALPVVTESDEALIFRAWAPARPL